MEAANQKRKEKNDRDIEETERALQEAQAQEDLYKKYQDVYNSYIEGTASKQDLAKTTSELVDLLGAEAVAVANLTGNYKDLNAEILKKKKEDADKSLKTAQDQLNAAKGNVEIESRDGRGWKDQNHYKVSFKTGMIHEDEVEVAPYIDNYFKENPEAVKGIEAEWNYTTNKIHGIDIKTDEFSAEKIVQLYDVLSQIRTNIQNEVDSSVYSSSELYNNIDAWLTKMEDEVEKYRTGLDNVAKYAAQSKGLDID